MLRRSVILPGLLALALPIAASATTLRGGADDLARVWRERGAIPPAPDQVNDLAFAEIYRMPVGPRGLELPPRAAELAGKRVRILGFMVRQAKPSPGVALLGPHPAVTNEIEYSLSDDLPVSTVFVVVPRFEDIAVPFTPGPLLLTGRFETSPREEADGRVSHLRLILDEDAAIEPAQDGADTPDHTVAPTAPGAAADTPARAGADAPGDASRSPRPPRRPYPFFHYPAFRDLDFPGTDTPRQTTKPT